MAWAAVFLGMIAGLLAAVLGYALAGLTFWASLLLYPGVGLAVSVSVIGILALTGGLQPQSQPQLKPAYGTRA